MNAITIQNLSKNFGKTKALQHISLEVNKNEIYGFVGPNGAGKSTTIKLLLNFIFPSEGHATIFGKDVVKYSAHLKQNVGYISSENNFYKDLKVIDLIQTSMRFHQNHNTALLDELCTLFEIEKNKRFKELSLGNKKKVAIVAALVNQPTLLIMDEPTNGLDPLMQQRLFQYLAKQKEMTIFLSSHNLTEIQEYCTKVAFIKQGEIIDIVDLTKEKDHHKVIELTYTSKQDYTMFNVEVMEERAGYLKLLYKDEVGKLSSLLMLFTIEDLKIIPYDITMKFMNFYEGEHHNGNM